jgi:hypothetical protein
MKTPTAKDTSLSRRSQSNDRPPSSDHHSRALAVWCQDEGDSNASEIETDFQVTRASTVLSCPVRITCPVYPIAFSRKEGDLLLLGEDDRDVPVSKACDSSIGAVSCGAANHGGQLAPRGDSDLQSGPADADTIQEWSPVSVLKNAMSLPPYNATVGEEQC